ncbi:MAG TPA: hypothetical protein VF630_15970, partial [Hymenobacter sp.]
FAELLAGGAPYDTARQQVRLGSFFTSNSVGLTASRGRWAYAGTVGFSEEMQRLTSALETTADLVVAGPPVRNDLRWARGRYYAQPGLSYKTEAWSTSLDLPLSYYHFTATDAPLGAGQRLHALVAEPNLSVRRELGALWNASVGAGLNNRFGDIAQVNYAYILRDYRTVQRNDAPLPRSQGASVNAGLYYKNPLKSLFFNASYSLSRTQSNRLYSNAVDANGALTTVALDRNNRALTHTVLGSVSQFISPWKTNLSLQLTGSARTQPQVLNDVLVQTRVRYGRASVKASVSAFDWGSLDYRAALTALRSAVAGAPAQPLALLQNHHAAVGVFPVGRHQLSLAADYYASQGPAPTVRAAFADLTYRYTLPTKRKIDLEAQWSNIFNTRQYQYSYVSQFLLAQSTYELRPAQVLASVRLSL